MAFGLNGDYDHGPMDKAWSANTGEPVSSLTPNQPDENYEMANDPRDTPDHYESGPLDKVMTITPPPASRNAEFGKGRAGSDLYKRQTDMSNYMA